ncbi:histone acetyltransferase subunit NuA4-domain-containing protein [Leucosporidium creatinivorum]|uniref:Chromatin modification-related protein EAF6 n=1 Tax=Leucosporidium creatinivorum TaxID=106004 RepID=A0A1Y2FW66_9BASI|nr:histone acetyltransferase subunit NuA4-domain-containing protein [Leucosporidium creatinivorum]
MSAAPADSSKETTASASATPATAATATPAKQAAGGSNGDKAAGEKTGDGKDEEGKEKEKEPAAPKPPHPLDGLSQAELRKKLEASKKELRGYLERKKKVDQDLTGLEASIYAFEGSYLSDALLPASSTSSTGAAQFGNIIKGYDSYLKAPAAGSDRKRGRGNDEPRAGDRMFSMSSATYQKAVEMRTAEQGAESASEEESTSSANRRKRNRH